MEKTEMNCYKCQKNYMVEIPEPEKFEEVNCWFYCPVCHYPMTFVGEV